MTADGNRKDGSEITTESRVEQEREVRDGKLHPFESHPRTPSGLKKSIKRRGARRVEGDSWAKKGWKGLKKERKRWGWKDRRADSVKWMKRGKTKRQMERRNLQ